MNSLMMNFFYLHRKFLENKHVAKHPVNLQDPKMRNIQHTIKYKDTDTYCFHIHRGIYQQPLLFAFL